MADRGQLSGEVVDPLGSPYRAPPKTAFVLGGGGVLGASQVGMLRALLEAGITPDVILGSSVGALNGALFAAMPTLEGVNNLAAVWTTLSKNGVFTESVIKRAVNIARYRTHLHSAEPLRRLLDVNLPVHEFEQLEVAFQCVAASIERAAAHWFTQGSLLDAVVASCAVPGLLPPAQVHSEHYFDGGLVDSTPLGRAIQLGAGRIYVLHVGRVERPLHVPRWPWQVGLVAFEIARRNRFVEAMASAPDGLRVHVLPSGFSDTSLTNLRYTSMRRVSNRIERAYSASKSYLAQTACVP